MHQRTGGRRDFSRETTTLSGELVHSSRGLRMRRGKRDSDKASAGRRPRWGRCWLAKVLLACAETGSQTAVMPIAMAAKILKMLIGCRPGETVGRGGGVDHEKIGRPYDLIIDFRLSPLAQVQNFIQDSTPSDTSFVIPPTGVDVCKAWGT